MTPPSSPASPGDAQGILRARALALAVQVDASPPAESLELLEFRLAQERYALETRHVSEVVPLGDLTPVPCTPPFVLGVVNLRGRIVPVMDIKKFIGVPARGLTDLHHIIMVRGQGLEFGILADAVRDVRSHAVASLQAAPSTLGGAQASYIKGVTAERLIVLDLDRMLADPALVVHEEAQA
ncbi:MAG TPA: chemotaxis protein CheW [Ramlibacter sp.]|nr:chemotaxis protein CheW [Ramlibacter sp.]